MATLDPKTRQLLELMAQLPPVDYDTVTAPEMRERAKRGRDAIEGAPKAALALVRDDRVDGPAGPIPVRVYDPQEDDGRPALVFFHGGGFVQGDLDTHDALCRRLARDGDLRVIAVDYRLAPEHPFPAGLEDCIAAVDRIRAQAARFGVDSDRIAVGGDSAGGNFAAVVARHFARAGGWGPKFQLLIYPVTQHGAQTASRTDFAEGYFLTRRGMDWFEALYLSGVDTDRQDERISPLAAPAPAHLAPALVITAGFDPLRDEGAQYAAALTAAGCAVEYVDYPDQVHGFFSFPAFSGVSMEAARDAARKTRAALG